MGICDLCGYETPKGYDYFKDKVSGVCLCEECHDGVDHKLMDLLSHEFSSVEAGFDDIDAETDDF